MARYENHRRALPSLRERRQTAERTLAEVASAVTVDMSTLAYIERGEKRASPELQAKLAECFSCAIDELFAPVEERPSRFDPLRDELLAAPGACGSPTCQDAQCPVEPGACHGCGRPAVTARQTARDRRWVKGYPTKYCSDGRCFSGARETERVVGISLSEAARRLGRSHHDIWVLADRLGRGKLIRGPRAKLWVLTEGDLERLRRQLAESPTAVVHRDARRRQGWYRRRFNNSPKMAGRLAKELAAAKGKSVGRRRELSAQEEHRIRELRANELSERAIARIMGLSRSQVHRFLAAEETGSKPFGAAA
jgi:transcriptional regulator with XRE-family HTH domain